MRTLGFVVWQTWVRIPAPLSTHLWQVTQPSRVCKMKIMAVCCCKKITQSPWLCSACGESLHFCNTSILSSWRTHEASSSSFSFQASGQCADEAGTTGHLTSAIAPTWQYTSSANFFLVWYTIFDSVIQMITFPLNFNSSKIGMHFIIDGVLWFSGQHFFFLIGLCLIIYDTFNLKKYSGFFGGE